MVATQSQQTQQFKCTGDCMKCLPVQRAYCASQHAYSNMRVLDKLMGIVMNLQEEVKSIVEKIEALQNNEALLFDPSSPGGNAPGTEAGAVRMDALGEPAGTT